MRIVTVALGSFMVGALCMSFLGRYTSTLPQSVFAQTAMRSKLAVPIVPPLTHITSIGDHIDGLIYAVDGIESKDGIFHDATFEYGGGAYRLENAAISGTVGFKFTGAAANTVSFLSAFGMIGCPAAKPPKPETNPNQPIMENAKLSIPYKGDLIGPFGQ